MRKVVEIFLIALLFCCILLMAFNVWQKFDLAYNGGSTWAKLTIEPVCSLWQLPSEYTHCKVVRSTTGRYAVNYEYYGSDSYLILEIDHVDYTFSSVQPITTFDDSCQALGLIKMFTDQNTPSFNIK